MPKPGISPKRQPFPVAMPRARKRARGRTQSAQTPLAIRTSGIPITPDLDAYVRQRIGFKLGKFAPYIERATVRFEDVNGPRGGADTMCRIKVVVSELPSVVVEDLGTAPAEAFDRAADRVERAVRRGLDRARETHRLPRLKQPRGAASEDVEADSGEPARPGRNFKLQTRKATAKLEDSQADRPSRKSTRGSANRAKQGGKLQRRQMQRAISPKSAARKSAARRHAT